MMMMMMMLNWFHISSEGNAEPSVVVIIEQTV